MDDKMDANEKLQADPIDSELRAIWQPAPAADPRLREKILAAAGRETGSARPAAAAIDLAARRPERASRRLAGPQLHSPRRGMSRSVIAAVGAVALLVGARIALKSTHQPGSPAGQVSQGGQAAGTPADPNELTAEDEQFALGGADDDDADDAPSVLELAADDDQGGE